MNHQSPQLLFDRLLCQPTRLALCAHLARCGGEAPFVEVRPAIGVKHASALSAHSRLLETAGYLEIRKGFVGRKARTDLVLTARGREALQRHKAAMGVAG